MARTNGGGVRVAQIEGVKAKLLEALLAGGGGDAEPETPEAVKAGAVAALGAMIAPCPHEEHARMYPPLRAVLAATVSWDLLPGEVAERIQNALIARAIHGGENMIEGVRDLFTEDRLMAAVLGAAIALGVGASVPPAISGGSGGSAAGPLPEVERVAREARERENLRAGYV